MKDSQKCECECEVRELTLIRTYTHTFSMFIVGSGGRYGRFSRISWQAGSFELFLTVVRDPFEAADVPLAAIRPEPRRRVAVRQAGDYLGLGRARGGLARRRRRDLPGGQMAEARGDGRAGRGRRTDGLPGDVRARRTYRSRV